MGSRKIQEYSIQDQMAALNVGFMARLLRNAQPTRYVWNAKGEEILNKLRRARDAMEEQVNG